MPIIKSAKKKMRQDVKKAQGNKKYKVELKKIVKKITAGKSTKLESDVKKAYSAIDKAAKKNVIHKNKASRLKSRVSKLALKK
jgi:small subunit ribosomal protein S20